MRLIKNNGLVAPSGFWDLSQEQIDDISNGCGPSGWGWIVPDRFRLLGVSFHRACDIHDYCYAIGMPKKDADNLFLENMLTLSESAYFGLRMIACRFAFIYYLAVKNGGQGAYNNSKS